MPTDLPDPETPPPDLPEEQGRVYSGTTVVLMIIAWTVVLLLIGTWGVRQLRQDPCWDRGPGSAPVPEECRKAPPPP